MDDWEGLLLLLLPASEVPLKAAAAAAAAEESVEEERETKGVKLPPPLLPSPEVGSKSGKVAVELAKKAMCPRSTPEAFSMEVIREEGKVMTGVREGACVWK